MKIKRAKKCKKRYDLKTKIKNIEINVTIFMDKMCVHLDAFVKVISCGTKTCLTLAMY